MSGLQINESLQLFNWYTFLRPSPSPRYKDLSRRIVEACKGHPLSLEVIGSFLYDKQDDTGCWIEAFHNITLNQEIHERLKISYNALSDDEKEIFMDIACYFIGEHKKLPIVFWKSLYKMVDTAVSNLSMKLLIKIDDKGVFDMHDHLQDMGRTIAEKERDCTRLWESAHCSTLSNNINFSRLRLNEGNPQRLEKLYRPGLHYLHLQNVPIEGMIEDKLSKLPRSLIWLRLERCGLAVKTNTNRAVKKPSHSRFVNDIWQLKILQLKGCSDLDGLSIFSLFSLPNIQLQHLDLGWSRSLKKLPDTIGNLSQLQHLFLEGCVCLKNLPDIRLPQLQHLDLRWCDGLNNLPDTIGNLSKLQYLCLRGCRSFLNLPDTIGNLSQLQHLDSGWCRSLDNLPDTIGNLSQLQHLDLRGCDRLMYLPDTIGNLSQLQHLDLVCCRKLNNLPDTIGNLSQLQHLDLETCFNLENLPDTIGNLSQLQYLKWKDGRMLKDYNIH
ncbi:hypothetical protein SUGI_0246890 [Cryptomeria japonica]|nr:hypothetical protein SUGI_0246890 [Cryptomeria japonica]